MGMIVSINDDQCPKVSREAMDRQRSAKIMRRLNIDSGNRLPLASRQSPNTSDTPHRNERTKTKPSERYNRRSPTVSLEPRPIEELHNERSYLTVDLQRQDERTRNLMAGLSQIEEECSSAQTPGEARAFRKQAGRMRSGLAEAERQEKLILLRLSELYIEIRSRERWSQVQQRREPSQTMFWQVDHPHLWMPQLLSPISPVTPLPPVWYCPDPVSMTWSSPLSPMSPEFVPGAFSFRDLHWDANRSGPESSNHSPCWVREKDCETPQNQHELNGWDANSGTNSRSLSTPTPSSSRTPERRMSLPTPDTTWPLE